MPPSDECPLNPLNANPEKWSNTLKQIVGKLPTICLSVFDHFMNLALKGLKLLYLLETRSFEALMYFNCLEKITFFKRRVSIML